MIYSKHLVAKICTPAGIDKDGILAIDEAGRYVSSGFSESAGIE